ncbi:ATP-binding protein [Euzebya rosea]|uniref:ATP-binding protein n=1 Tax=Euzebya rosea TaxID=2052804 RepID=UPI000D3E3B35|nr:ATP-binding protein [Euzebya rosea]
MSQWLDLVLPPDPALVGVARTMAVAAATVGKLEPGRVHDLRTCVSEGVTNAVKAHRDAGVAEAITLRVGLDEDALVVEIMDRGPGLRRDEIVVSAVEGMELAELAERGYGLTVMESLADGLEIELPEDAGGTTVRLRFSLTEASSADGITTG